MVRKFTFVWIALGLLLALSSTASAQKTTVLRVVIVKTDNVSGYLAELENGKALMKKLGVNQNIRVWQATFAGPNAGSIAVAIEFPNMAALADADSKTRGDKDYQAWIKNMEKVRTIVSDSIYREL